MVLMSGLLAIVATLGCTKGKECDTCDTDDDCTGGRICVRFDDESHRCGSGVGATTCRVR
jgi:hypothetical protein